MYDVMLDLETFGTKPGCVLRSIGAAFFDLRGGIGARFYTTIDQQSCLDVGLTIDPKTAEWWAQQDGEVQQALLKNPKPLQTAVAEFHAFFRKNDGKRVWCQGATFDVPVWEAAVTAAGFKQVPWKYWDVRDTRTAYALYGFDPRTVARSGAHHNALDDALHQIECLHRAVENHSLATL
jgi:hypothetical protein